MKRWIILTVIGLFWSTAQANGKIDALVKEIHDNSVVIDLHVDTLLKVQKFRHYDYSLLKNMNYGQVDIEKMRKASIKGIFFAIWVPPKYYKVKGGAKLFALNTITRFQGLMYQYRNHLVQVRSTKGLFKAMKNNKIGVFLALEGAYPLNGDVNALHQFHQLGIKYIGLTWDINNEFGDSSGEKPRHNGLSLKGQQLVLLANRLGLIIDVSHASDKTFWGIVRTTSKPIIASHSNSRAVYPHRRNLTDDQIRAIAKLKGVIGVNFYYRFISGKRAELVTSEDLVRHIAHIVKLVGFDYVAIGSDLDGLIRPPADLKDISYLPNLTKALLKKGYHKKEIEKFLGGNMIRVLQLNEDPKFRLKY